MNRSIGNATEKPATRGLLEWIIQRISALYLALFLIALSAKFTLSPPTSHLEWQAWMASPLWSVATLLFIISLASHSWIGFLALIPEYIHSQKPQILLLGLTALGLISCVLWTLKILIMLHIT